VEENILLALSEGRVIRSIIKAFERRDSKVEEEKVKELLEVVGLSDKRYDLAGDLSYGQQKLLTIACCLALEPRLLLLDEPVAGIAPEMIEKILGIIKELPSKGKSVIMIEHNLDAIMQVCDRVIFMDAGKKICEGTPEEVRNDPRVIEAYID
jgi:ABC-type branched-subunit amino acid transport system ATPase component